MLQIGISRILFLIRTHDSYDHSNNNGLHLRCLLQNGRLQRSRWQRALRKQWKQFVFKCMCARCALHTSENVYIYTNTASSRYEKICYRTCYSCRDRYAQLIVMRALHTTASCFNLAETRRSGDWLTSGCLPNRMETKPVRVEKPFMCSREKTEYALKPVVMRYCTRVSLPFGYILHCFSLFVCSLCYVIEWDCDLKFMIMLLHLANWFN